MILFLFTMPGLVLMINVFSVRVAARFLDFISSLKLLVLVLVIVGALYRVIRHGEIRFSTLSFVLVVCCCDLLSGFPDVFSHAFAGSSTTWSSITLGLYGVVFAYDGWQVFFSLNFVQR